MKIQVVSDFIIDTYNPSEYKYGFNIVKTPMGDSVQFTVQCIPGQYYGDEDADKQAHYCAYYIKTSILPPNPHITEIEEEPGKDDKGLPKWIVITASAALIFPLFFLAATLLYNN